MRRVVAQLIWQRSVRLGLSKRRLQENTSDIEGTCRYRAPLKGRNQMRPIKNEQNKEDQSEATAWIISDFSEEEAMAKRSA
jgi:hypothetical protein